MRELAVGHHLVPLTAELVADCDTPVGTLLRLGTTAECFLLESVEGGERVARWSFLGRDPVCTLTVRDGVATVRDADGAHAAPCSDPLDAVAALLGRHRVATLDEPDAPPLRGGAIGFLGYETARCYERLPELTNDPLGVPDAHFGVYQTLLAFDHVRQRLLLRTHVDVTGDIDDAYAAATARLTDLRNALRRTPLPLPAPSTGDPVMADREEVANWSRDAFISAVETCKRHIIDGDIYQVQISRRFALPLRAPAFELYRALRTINPSPYMFFLATPHGDVVGASPEMLIRVTGRDVQYHPIAGTRRRGRDLADDAAMEAELRGSEKERAEHLMLVDLGRNDLGRVCRTGSVRVTELMAVERYSHVMHLVSSITGTLQDGTSALDALRACFPAGTVTGAPKVRAMEIIATLEPERRGIYAGAVGYVGFDGDLDTAIALRTVLVRDGVAHAQAAGGIVADSTAHEEALEIDNKTAALVAAVQRAAAGTTP